MPQRRGAPALRRARGFGLRPTDSAPAGAAFLRGAGGASRAVAAAGARGGHWPSPISGAVALPWWRHVALALDWWWRACTALQPHLCDGRRAVFRVCCSHERHALRGGEAARVAQPRVRACIRAVCCSRRACAAAGGADLALTSTREQAARVARLLCCESRNEQMEINSAREVGRGCLAARGERESGQYVKPREQTSKGANAFCQSNVVNAAMTRATVRYVCVT